MEAIHFQGTENVLGFRSCLSLASFVKWVTDIYLMEVFNTSCQRASLRALAKTAVYIDFDSLWVMLPPEGRNPFPLCCFGSPRLPKWPIYFRITTRSKSHKAGSSDPTCHKVEIQSKVSKYAFLACKWQFISIRE